MEMLSVDPKRIRLSLALGRYAAFFRVCGLLAALSVAFVGAGQADPGVWWIASVALLIQAFWLGAVSNALSVLLH